MTLKAYMRFFVHLRQSRQSNKEALMIEKLGFTIRSTPLLRKFFLTLRTHLVIKPRIRRVMKSGDDISPDQTDKPVVVVPLLEMSHYQSVHILLMAKSFSLRGYEVIVVVCDEFLPACELKSNRNRNDSNPCFACTLNRTAYLDLFNLRCLTMSQLFSSIADPVKYGAEVMDKYDIDREEVNRIVADSVSRFYYGAEELASEFDEAHVRAEHTKTAYLSIAIGEILWERFRPSICLNNMNVYSAWGPCFNFLESQGVFPVVISQTAFNLSAIRINNAGLFKNKRTYQRFLDGRNNQPLTTDESAQLDEFIHNRFSGNDNLMREWKYFNNSQTIQLGDADNKKNVVLFPNIPWDQGLDEFTGFFENVFDWVAQTIDHFACHPNINIWIKPHPAEVRGKARSEKSVAEFIKMKYQVLPENVFIIDAELGINTYKMFPFIDLGVVLTGTLGLEMALANIDVVSAGVNPCYGLNLLVEPANAREYFDAIEFGDNSIKKPSDLRLFCYFYFINQSFSWPLTERVWGESNSRFRFSSEAALEPGKLAELDAIFDEVFHLENDFVKNRIERYSD